MKHMESAFTVRHHIKKFTSNIIKAQINNVLLFPGENVHLLMGPSHCIQLNAKIVKRNSQYKAADIIYSTFEEVLPAVIINQVLERSSRYRRLVRKVQRNWISKYRARLMMLENFSQRHVKQMLMEYPYLRLAEKIYTDGGHCRTIAYAYLKDETAKFKHIYNAYEQRVEEIDHFIQTNKAII